MKINIRCPLNGLLGYGHVSINIVKHLIKLGHEVALFPIGQPHLTNSEDVPFIQQAIQNAHKFDYEAPSILIWHEHDMSCFAGRGKKIGLSFFERNKFDEVRKHQMLYCDSWIAPSTWAKNIIVQELQPYAHEKEEFVRDIDTHTKVIPMGVDTNIFKPYKTPDSFINSNITSFLNVGKIEIRKGHDILPDLFINALGDKDYKLYMMWTNPFLGPEEVKKWEDMYRSKLGNKVEFIPQVNSDESLAKIMSSVDCCIFPTRVEGFGLPILQSLACGVQVITTDYGAQSEFVNEENCHLIHITEKEPAYDGKWFFGNFDWAKIGEVEQEQMVEYIRQVYNNPESFNGTGLATVLEFKWGNTCEKIMEMLE